MADAKVSELTAATTAGAADELYVVQSSASKKMSVATLFADVATPVKFSDKIAIADSETITTVGATINITSNVTYFDDPDAGGNTQILAGVDGQIKIVVLVSNLGAHTITITGTRHANTVALSSAGDSATFIYNSTENKWFYIGGNATVT